MPQKVSPTDQDREAYARSRTGGTSNITSTCVGELSYDGEARTLFIRFVTSGKVYFYLGVPEDVWLAQISASSKGKSFNATLREKYHYGELQ
jgi:hypothetical protein